jgi:hypothetical protein
MRAVTLLIFSLMPFALAACGGGGGGGNDTTPVAVGTPPVAGPLAHCAGSGGGFFKNVSTDVGLCYEVTGSEPEVDIHQMGGGLAYGDIDNDGMSELYVSYGRYSKGQLFSYDGARFVEVAGNNGIAPTGVDQAGYFIDIDADGWNDFVSIQYEGIQVFVNDQTGQFADMTSATNIYHDKTTYSMAAADYDVDGDVDLFFGHWGNIWDDTQPLSQYLWQNDGTGRYTDVSTIVPIRPKTRPGPGNPPEAEYSFTPTFADINSDGYPDMLLAGDFESSQVLLNDAGQRFIDITTPVISDESGMGASVGDYDRDGDLDWFVSAIYVSNYEALPVHGSGNRLYRNDGTGNFEDVTEFSGVRDGEWGWGSCFADFDNDGNLDIFHTNGMPPPAADRYHADPSRLFMSNGDGTFTDKAAEYGITHTDQGRGVVCADYDGDGKMDIFIANNGNSPTVFKNDNQNGNHYLQIDLIGAGANPDAIGARVTVTTASGSQMQELCLGTWYLSQGPQTLHFGLGQDFAVSAIDIVWPGPGGTTSRIENVSTDQRLEIVHP